MFMLLRDSEERVDRPFISFSYMTIVLGCWLRAPEWNWVNSMFTERFFLQFLQSFVSKDISINCWSSQSGSSVPRKHLKLLLEPKSNIHFGDLSALLHTHTTDVLGDASGASRAVFQLIFTMLLILRFNLCFEGKYEIEDCRVFLLSGQIGKE